MKKGNSLLLNPIRSDRGIYSLNLKHLENAIFGNTYQSAGHSHDYSKKGAHGLEGCHVKCRSKSFHHEGRLPDSVLPGSYFTERKILKCKYDF